MTRDEYLALLIKEQQEDDLESAEVETSEPYVPQLWRPAREVDALTPGRDGVPTVDDDLDADPDAAPRSYPAWDEKNTRVVSGPVGAWARENPGKVGFHANGRWYPNRWEAMRDVEKRLGPVLEAYHLPNRYCFRVGRN